MQLRTTSVITALALLSSAANSSPPLAFTPNPKHSAPAILSNRIRKRVLAQTFLRALPADNDFVQRHPRRADSTTTTTSTRTNTGISSSSSSSSTLSSALQKEFELNLGKAVDTLKSDYPKLLSKNPSWDIFHADLEVIDPTGVSLHGLENYKVAFGFIHGVVKVFYCDEKSGVTSVRVAYDLARKCIRVSWNVELVPRMIYGGTRHILHVDGISEYYLDRESGLITEHKVSHLLINDQTVRPANGIFNALAEMSPNSGDAEGVGVPVFFKAEGNQAASLWEDMSHVKFQSWNPLTNRGASTSLFSNDSNEATMQQPNENSINTDNPVPYDLDALQRKNTSRKKFGMPPLTPEEFIKIEEEVRAMDAVNKKKAAYLAEKIAQQKLIEKSMKQQKEEGFLSNLFGGALKNGCESNFDCERPQVCCDIGVKKICCSNGLGIVDGIPLEKWERATLRVPLPNDNVDY